MRFRSSVAGPVAFLALSFAGCAGAGGPGVEGPAAAALFARYDGSWVLVPEESGSLSRERGDGRRPPGGEPTGFLPPAGGGRGGGRGPGGGPDGGPGGGRGGRGGGGGPPPERGGRGPRAGRAGTPPSFEAPRAFTLRVTDSTFVLTPTPAPAADSTAPRPGPGAAGPLSVRLDGESAEASGPEGRTETRGRWKDGEIRIERKRKGGASESEIWRIDAQGRLVVSREISLPKGPTLQTLSVFRHATPG